jgi:hypothetical protein
MKTLFTKIFLSACLACLYSICSAQSATDWPKAITASDGTIIKMYQPQPESFAGNVLKSRSAISVLENGSTDPIFGTFWSTSKVETDRDNREVSIESIKISDIKIPGESDQSKVDFIKTTLESQIPQSVGQIPLDEVLASLDQNLEETKLSNDINNQPPAVTFTTQPSLLVLIDGTPKLQRNNDWGVDVVVNSPFTILKNNDGSFYLYGGHHWYAAPSATGPYTFAGDHVPANLSSIENSLNANKQNNNSAASTADNVVSNIVVSTKPAELIQSKGEPNFSPIEGTSLLFVKNSDNDIFMDVNSQQYYVLISGRWYKSRTLSNNSQWEYTAADKLPADFAKIPEGSPKDNVLASVGGTDAAREAVMDAQIPQTAKIDRRTATTSVTYNGDPQFQSINGTKLQYAVNTSSTVLRYKGEYYVVDNGVWFISDNPTGPWTVSTERPDDLDMIPPSSPAYNTKYVYVYDVTPDYVYMGYTPGYLNSYIYGPTVVYGTGFYYDPWFGSYYYPRPWSWGFNFGYNPWFGWSFGFGYSYGWFNSGFGYHWGGWHGGWWGPSIYHPAYFGWGGGNHGYGGYYGRNGNVTINRNRYTNINYNNNIYRNRGGVVSRDNSRVASGNNNRGGYGNGRSNVSNGYPSANNNRYGQGSNNTNNRTMNRGNSQAPNRNNGPANNVYSDRQGNVYQRAGQGQWQQRSNRQWAPVNNNPPEVTRNLDRQQQMRDRGQVRTQNFQRAQSFSAPSSRSSGGSNGSSSGGRSSSGGGGSSRSSGGGGGGGGGRSGRGR